MIGYPITYGDNLTPEQANKSLKEVQMAAMLVISVYLLLNQVANAADGNTSPSGIQQTPNNTEVCPATPANTTTNITTNTPANTTTNITPNITTNTPTNINAGKEIFTGITGITAALCSTGAKSGNFWIGVTCGLVVVAGMRMALKK